MKNQIRTLFCCTGRGRLLSRKYKLLFISILVSMIILSSILYGQDTTPVSIHSSVFVVNTISQTITKYDMETEQVNNTFAVTGLYPNKMAIDENYIYLTNSGDDNVQVIDAQTGSTVRLIEVEEFSNPYDIIEHNGYLYVTGLFTNKVYKIDKQTGRVVDDILTGTAPQGLIIANNKLYVANSGFSYPDFYDGELAVIDLEEFSIITKIETELNPQRMDLDRLGRIHLVCIGDYDENRGSILIIDTIEDEIIDSVSFGNYPYNITIAANDIAYVGDALNQGIVSYDVMSMEIINDLNDPFAEGGGGLLSYNDYIVIADAGDFTSNSIISFYDLQEGFIFSFQSAIGAVDLIAAPAATTVQKTVQVPRLAVYPNPASGPVKFDILQPAGINSNPYGQDTVLSLLSEYKAGIFNIRGQLIKEISVMSGSSAWNGRTGNDKDAPTGLYFIRISDRNNNTLTTKPITIIR